jgi:hypothetical protein
MEKRMSKTNDTAKLVALDDQLDDHGALADSELGEVNGGAVDNTTKRAWRSGAFA